MSFYSVAFERFGIVGLVGLVFVGLVWYVWFSMYGLVCLFRRLCYETTGRRDETETVIIRLT